MMKATLRNLFLPVRDRVAGEEIIERFVRAMRSHLGMEVGFISEFVGDRPIFRHVDAARNSPIRAGDVMPLAEGYCKQVVEGRIPELIPDTSSVPAALQIPDTRSLPIGAHISVPIRLPRPPLRYILLLQFTA